MSLRLEEGCKFLCLGCCPCKDEPSLVVGQHHEANMFLNLHTTLLWETLIIQSMNFDLLYNKWAYEFQFLISLIFILAYVVILNMTSSSILSSQFRGEKNKIFTTLNRMFSVTHYNLPCSKLVVKLQYNVTNNKC